jgi:hypothetical protein
MYQHRKDEHGNENKYVHSFTLIVFFFSESPLICLEDFDNALKCFKPASLHGIKLHQGSDLTWQDVGGLNDIKQTLKETLEWPAKVFCM